MSADSPSSIGRFDVTPYRADGGYSAAGSGLLIGTSMLAGAVLGAFASLVGRWFYWIGVFPIGIGLVLGCVIIWAIQTGRVRSPLLGGVAGFFGGCVAILALHYGDYLQFRWALSDQTVQALDMTRGQEDAAIRALGMDPQEAALFRGIARRYHTFPGYVDETAREGVRIQRGGHGQNLGYHGSYVYWGMEVLIVAGIAFALARSTAGEPFCTACGRWKEQLDMGALAPPADVAIDAVKTGELSHLRTLAPTDEAQEAVQVLAWPCGHCGAAAPVDVKLRHHFINKKNLRAVRDVGFVTYPGAALPVLEALFPPTPEPTPPPETPTEGQASDRAGSSD